MNVKVVKLISGEEILTHCKLKQDKILIKNPITIVGFTQQGGISLAPMSPFLKPDQEIEIQMKDIIYIGDPNSSIESEYIKATTGLEVVGNKGIFR